MLNLRILKLNGTDQLKIDNMYVEIKKIRVNEDYSLIYQSDIFDKYEIIGCNVLVEQKNNGTFDDNNFKIDVDEFRKCNFVEVEDRVFG